MHGHAAIGLPRHDPVERRLAVEVAGPQPRRIGELGVRGGKLLSRLREYSNRSVKEQEESEN
jgi:hypothetical protein